MAPTRHSVRSAVLGFPRIGAGRELKKAVESYWKGEISAAQLEAAGRELRARHWRLQRDAGIDVIPSNDFSFYDQVLDLTALVGAVPERFGGSRGPVGLDTYFAMARGIQEKQGVGAAGVAAMEMTKWFDTNYHYLVPEFRKDQRFRLSSEKIFDEYREALALGIPTRPVLIGPVTYLLLGKSKEKNFNPLDLLGALLPVYVEILKTLKGLGAVDVQIDEPMLVTDLDEKSRKAYRHAYRLFAKEIPQVRLCLTTYFGPLGNNRALALSLPAAGLHVDLVRGPEELRRIAASARPDQELSFGIVDGRNIWKNDLAASLRFLRAGLPKKSGRSYLVASSCSLLHAPVDLAGETELDAEAKNWLAFSAQKIDEIEILKKALSGGDAFVSSELAANAAALSDRRNSPRVHQKEVQRACAAVKAADYRRKSPFGVRRELQHAKLRLPLFPTTTIGSFPQTSEVRRARSDFKAGVLPEGRYNEFLKSEIRQAVQKQIEIGLDVLVHGEAERNDLFEFFGETLGGFLFTKNGWVQSYGTRCVKPPVIYGDVDRPEPMTVEWASYAQSLTKKPMKGMLTGPVTILQWSFVRDDQPRSLTAKQIALAVRRETADLEKAGIGVIQIDEPAIREGLPLRKSRRPEYLRWAVDAFRLASSPVRDETQIHTHMCYSEFNDIIRAIAKMDADVISIETSRSQMELLDAFVKFRYPNEIGPGVYDIHSPRVPETQEMEALLEKASGLIPPANLWVNPDCGLKTRGWEETELSLRRMVEAARTLRKKFSRARESVLK